MMIIYKVMPDINFRFVFPEDDIYDSEDWVFNCKPLSQLLPEFKAYFDEDEPSATIPDIAYIGMATIAFKAEVAKKLSGFLDGTGELLPFHISGELWYCYNPLKSVDAIDSNKSTYKVDDGIRKLHLVEYVFDTTKLGNVSLFKIPDDNFSELFCVSSEGSIEQDFFNFISECGFTGLKFQEVYRDE